MISIIIPVHNQADKISFCLESIALQTERDLELIIVDDGSNDNVHEVVDQFIAKHPSQAVHFFSKQNEGSNPTRNFGFAKSTGDFVIFCDADVVMNPQMLAKMKQTLEINPDKSFVFSSFYYGAKLFKLFPYDETRLKKMPYIHTSSLIRRADFPGFDPTLKRLQDWDLWLTMLESGKKGIWIDEPLYKTLLGKGHMSNWLPKVTYKLLPFLASVKKYKAAVMTIKTKHKLI